MIEPGDLARALPSGNNGGTRNYQTIIPPMLLASLRGPQAATLPEVLTVQQKEKKNRPRVRITITLGFFIYAMTGNIIDSQGYIFLKNYVSLTKYQTTRCFWPLLQYKQNYDSVSHRLGGVYQCLANLVSSNTYVSTHQMRLFKGILSSPKNSVII